MQTTIKPKLILTSLKKQFGIFEDCWHLADYFPHSTDALSGSIIKYKQQDIPTVRKWNNLALKHLAKSNLHPDYIVRALGHRELVSTGAKALDELCSLLSRHYKISYNPLLLMKKQFTKPLHHLSAKQRMRELENMYVFNLLPPQTNPLKILIVDEIVTTGATMTSIHEAITRQFPTAKIYFFTLAKTYDKFHGSIRRR